MLRVERARAFQETSNVFKCKGASVDLFLITHGKVMIRQSSV